MFHAVFRVLLLALPKWIRQDWGAEMSRTFRDRMADVAHQGGTWNAALFCSREAGSVLLAACQARLVRWPRGGAADELEAEIARLSGLEASTTEILGDLAPTPIQEMLMYGEDNRGYKVAWACALSFHLLLFAAVFPETDSPVVVPPGRDAWVIQPLPPKPPEEPERKRTVKKRTAPPVPIPDPTPHEPEPLVEEIIDYEPALEMLASTDYIVAPPTAGPPNRGQGPVRAGVDVEPPQLLAQVQPVYPELAVRARKECVVVIEAVIDTAGGVDDARILRPCGLGLDEAALEAVSQWEYQPTHVNGRPVEVLLTVTVVFELRR